MRHLVGQAILYPIALGASFAMLGLIAFVEFTAWLLEAR